MTYTTIRAELDGAVGVLTMARPETLNAASLTMVDELRAALTDLPSRGARALVLTGEGRGFCSGADLTDPGHAGAFDAEASVRKHYNPLVEAVRALPVPLITAVNGPAVGIGCAFALLGDLIVAAESAYFATAFSRIGLIPDGGSTWLLPRLVGKARAMEMALLGERIGAPTALQWGLINRVAPDQALRDEAVGLARRLAEGPASLGSTRRLIWSAMDAEWPEAISGEATAQGAASKTEDFMEGLRAFAEKRPPRFSGR